MNFWQILEREVNQLFIKDAKRAFYLFGASALYAVLFGLLYFTGIVNYIPTVVYDQDQTQFSRSLVQAFEDSDRYEIVAYVTTQDEMERYLRDKKANAALAIPPNFTRDVKLGKASSILLEADGSNIVIANAVMSSAQEIMMTFSGEVGRSLVEAIGQLPEPSLNKAAPIDFRLRVLNNPVLSYLDFFVIGVALAALQQGIILSVGASMTNENFAQFQGQSALKVVAAKLLPYFIGGIAAYILALTIIIRGFGIPNKASFVTLLMLGAAFAFIITAMGSLMGAVCKDEVGLTQMSLAYTVPAFIFSGYTWPIHSMDTFSTMLSYLFPITYAAGNLRSLMLTGYAPDLTISLLIMIAAGVLMFGAVCLQYYRGTASHNGNVQSSWGA